MFILLPSITPLRPPPPLFRRSAVSATLKSSPPPVVADTLKILQWDKLCETVASFAGTALGRDATKAQLADVAVSFEESKRLLAETTSAIRLIDYGGGGFDFASVDTVSVKSAIGRVSRGSVLEGMEALAVVGLMQFAENLQGTVKAAIKEDGEWYTKFMPLSEVIMDIAINPSFIKLVQQVIDEEGSVKDNASSELRRSRNQVRAIEGKICQLMERLIREEKNEASSMEVCIANGRYCLKLLIENTMTFDGLVLSSGPYGQSILEPVAAVPLNDELQHARLAVAKAEEEVLTKLTDKMLAELDVIRSLLQIITKLDVIGARAKYTISYGGTFPEIYMPNDQIGKTTKTVHDDQVLSSVLSSHLTRRNWKLYIPRAYHPLLLKRHREDLHQAKKDVAGTTAEIRRRSFQGKHVGADVDLNSQLQDMKYRVSELEKNHPIPVDFMISEKTGVLVMTGPNTGGKTISLKTVGLASLMAKVGLYILSSEPVKVPWFDGIFAVIGDEQSLTQSLSTFSGHLKQIAAIRSHSTNQSLVLLDEIGAGTNPLEGAALGMSILESFVQTCSFLTIATTHHGELKTLKYSNDAFENACVDFDEVSLRPTYKILWGIPGRSNAINVAERLGLPSEIIDNARKLHGAASAEVNEVIIDMERFKQQFHQNLEDAAQCLKLSRELYKRLSVAKQSLSPHTYAQNNKKVKAITDAGIVARSILRHKMQAFRESFTVRQNEQLLSKIKSKAAHCNSELHETTLEGKSEVANSNFKLPKTTLDGTVSPNNRKPALDGVQKIPAVGDRIHVPSIGKEGTVLKVEASKGFVLVQANNMKLRLKLEDVAQQMRT